jgi:hypothetical protein
MSLDEFEAGYRQEIYEQAESLIQDHLWWNEPLTLFDRIAYPLHLTGESNLVREYLSDAYAPRRVVQREHDVYLALVDYAKIVEVLGQLGEAHDITWRLFHSDAGGRDVDIGYIEAGKPDVATIKFMLERLERYGLEEGMLWDSAKQLEIYALYFDDDDEPIF